MKLCAACHEDLPKDSYSKKQWKLDEYQRRCKVCVADNREVQPPPQQANNDTNTTNTNGIVKLLDFMYLEDGEKMKRISDEELFKQSQYEDCPICFLRLPELQSGSRYQTCCGKVICSGCAHASVYDDQGNEVDNEKCAFCRTPDPTSEEEMVERYKIRVEANDPKAMFKLGVWYSEGIYGYSLDHKKALELYYRAADLGYAEAYCNIGYAYSNGEGVEVDEEKAEHYYELAAMGGNERARHNLGYTGGHAGNFDRALKHYMIAVRGGNAPSLKQIKLLYTNGLATKDDYTKALQLYQAYLGEIKSQQRDEAAAFSKELYRYY